jgi:hypothetical protein
VILCGPIDVDDRNARAIREGGPQVIDELVWVFDLVVHVRQDCEVDRRGG